MKPILTLLLVSFSCFVFGQNAAVELPDMNLLYVGYKTPVNIAISDVKDKHVVVKTDGNCKYTKLKDGDYLQAKRGAKTAQIVIGVAGKKDTVWVDTVNYRVRILPKPIAQFGELPNDGLPKRKEHIIEQKEIIATMGNGFALPIAYEIKSFRLIIAYTDKPAVLFSANGSQLTRRMLQKIEGLKKGDRILIEAIKAQEKTMGFNANLSPIIITVIGQKKHISQVYGKFEYVKVFDSDKADSNQYHLPIYGVNNIPDEFKNGVLSKFYNGHKGFHRIDETFKDGVVKKEVFIDDMGIKVYERTIKDSILSELKTFYETGELKTLGPVKMGIKYMGNDHFVYCFHPNKEPANSDVQIRRMEDYDTCLFLTEESIEKDLHQIYLRYGFVPHESFTSYYKSGSLKTGGNLMILMGRDEPTPDTYTYLERKEYYPYHDKSAMKGEWFFYNEDGSLIEKRIYQAGKRVF